VEEVVVVAGEVVAVVEEVAEVVVDSAPPHPVRKSVTAANTAMTLRAIRSLYV
jgi:hypothetical protein